MADADDPDDDRSFARLVKDVKPLPRRDEIRVPPPGKPGGRALRAGPATETEAAGPGEDGPVRFVHPNPDELLLGFAPGLDRRGLRRLRSGRWRPERRLDLHGLDRDGAREALLASVAAATEAGERCVLVVHGRGQRSLGEPVLRSALRGWLTEAPLGRHVLAFAPAVPDDGGAGATYVLLRRSERFRSR
jgi:DNA-nicking Smr family endonuclease